MIHSNKVRRMTFYPMAGGPKNQFANTLEVLIFINKNSPSRDQFLDWFMRQFESSSEFARKVLEIILKGCELVHLDKEKKLSLADKGKELIEKRDPHMLLKGFIENYGGFEELFEALTEYGGQTSKVLLDQWKKKIIISYPDTSHWGAQNFSTQFQHRLDWLRSLGFVQFVSGSYLLSSNGLKIALELKKKAVSTSQEAMEISHHELEKKIRFLGEFFQFEVRRPSVNDILPSSRTKMRKDRLLDCLWVRTVHFAGKIQYPVEIQISGSIADSIERLEMVANFVQKALIITDQEQQEEIRERLEAKRSPLLDKIVFIDIEDIDKIVEAATIMKAFTDRVFG